MSKQEKRIIRNYNVRESTQKWLEKQAKKGMRSTIKQVELLIEVARTKSES